MAYAAYRTERFTAAMTPRVDAPGLMNYTIYFARMKICSSYCRGQLSEKFRQLCFSRVRGFEADCQRIDGREQPMGLLPFYAVSIRRPIRQQEAASQSPSPSSFARNEQQFRVSELSTRISQLASALFFT